MKNFLIGLIHGISIILLWIIFSLILTKIPVGTSHAEVDTIGVITYCGFPFRVSHYAPGLSIGHTLGNLNFYGLLANTIVALILAIVLCRFLFKKYISR